MIGEFGIAEIDVNQVVACECLHVGSQSRLVRHDLPGTDPGPSLDDHALLPGRIRMTCRTRTTKDRTDGAVACSALERHDVRQSNGFGDRSI
jgi:hypothetical protein